MTMGVDYYPEYWDKFFWEAEDRSYAKMGDKRLPMDIFNNSNFPHQKWACSLKT